MWRRFGVGSGSACDRVVVIFWVSLGRFGFGIGFWSVWVGLGLVSGSDWGQVWSHLGNILGASRELENPSSGSKVASEKVNSATMAIASGAGVQGRARKPAAYLVVRAMAYQISATAQDSTVYASRGSAEGGRREGQPRFRRDRHQSFRDCNWEL